MNPATLPASPAATLVNAGALGPAVTAAVAASGWQPRAEDLSNLIQLFVRSTHANSQVQAQLMQQLHSFASVPDFPNYLAFIFALTNEAVAVRTVAGLTLKNHVRDAMGSLHPQVLEFVKSASLHALADADQVIRATSGTIITTVNKIDTRIWPDIVPKLLELIDTQSPALEEGAFGALRKICEDSCNELEEGDPQIMSYLIQKLLPHMHNANVKVRTAAIESLNQFILARCEPLMLNINTFVTSIYQLTSDQNKGVRRAICQSFVLIFEVTPDTVIPELNNVVSFMLFCTQDEEEKVALEASEFWLAFAEQDRFRDHLEPYLPQIVPILAKGMVYSDEEVMMLGGDEDDANVPDNIHDIKPRHHKSRNHTNLSTQDQAKKADGGEFSDDDEEDYDEDTDEVDNEWNVRKCSAASIDVLATVFKEHLLEVLLPYLTQQLNSPDWLNREAGILALGAIAEGCTMGMIPHLPTLIPILLTTLKDKKPLVRSISCWTLGRYANWVVHGDPSQLNIPNEQQAQHRKLYFEPLLEGLLIMTLDNNKRVQETGCSALAVLEEVAGEYLVPYLGPILQTLGNAFTKYQHKNLLILYDALGTLADAVGPGLDNPQLVDLFMPCLTQKWELLADGDSGIFPLFECLSSVAMALGPGFLPYTPIVWDRCLRIISTSLLHFQNYQQNPEQAPEPDKDSIVVAQDLLSGVTQGLGSKVSPFISSGNPSILDILTVCLKHPFSEVRQSACALLGDFAINTFAEIKPRVNEYMQHTVPLIQLGANDDMTTAISNNATWAAGEIALKMEGEMQVWVQPLLERLIPLLLSGNKQTLKENSAITIGRLSIANSAIIAPLLGRFAHEWCETLGRIRDNLEKESAFQGFCRLIVANPNGLVPHLVHFCDAVVQWSRISPDLNETFRHVLTMYVSGMGDQWAVTVQGFPILTRQRLKERYNL
ncbi:hypothetical protein BASA50_000731 [Batrachochytrium salamandrivorans]|uniref:Importin N-terminal domain-containing protein n=1 Tax=Batrachochytrium salamandrivorans TaxID=1357716 RepID=A0ABQ8ETF1_9FUNG|nr:hypothetical protein BASA60_004838 [Batrachochytrium salamandrivorans]KAH6576813.1 hypothetical protein BASA62_001264 [Batrachochytrium salamandrivorans]KAH6585193.1 hypothetical protein BASA61_006986 [Batrachochytrium salamandrivorans]KAH6586267.1 hypothetical protein BASA50_000731 [Batrachochytrium salamandrivorans]KAH9254926.1 hypothetical protein BASA81_006993 [Batrachochytrium salamandrivorans]